MSLRQKLMSAFLIMILFPCILIGTIGTITFRTSLKKYNAAYGVAGSPVGILTDPFATIAGVTLDEYNELCTTVKVYSERLDNPAWLEAMESRLEASNSYLVLLKNGESAFIGDTEHFSENSGSILGAISLSSDPDAGAILSFGNGGAVSIVRHRAYAGGNGEPQGFILVTKVIPFFSNVRKVVAASFVFLLLAIVLTAGFLLAWLYRSIFKPINALQAATREIGQGNLNFRLERRENDEIGELCNDFDEMRRHLKTQIDRREQYEQDVREMISNVSHDLKTPLTAIKGYAEGMLDGVADTKEKQDKYLKTICVRATDMTLLVDELSYYSKLDNNKLPYNFERVNALAYFGDCVEEYATELEIKDFTVSFLSEIDPDTQVVMDCEQIRRVMNNLIGNSVKYRNEDIHGELTVRLTDAENSVRISVTDNGIGISKEAQPHIFDRFYRADKSRTSGRAGTGIGLAIVKKIVTEHGGRVFAKSELGKGTTISFTVKKGV